MAREELFDPILRSAQMEQIVMEGNSRMYYPGSKAFRFMRFYGGICSAYANGCGLLCKYCYNYSRNEKPTGVFYYPEEVAMKLITLAEKNKSWNFRLTGAEPFLGSASANHLFEIIRLIQEHHRGAAFVIESNAVYLGRFPEILNDLPKGNIRLRIALKGHDEACSQKVTGAKGAFDLQIAGILAASERRIRCTVATMPEFVNASLISLPVNVIREKEHLKIYPGTQARLHAAGLR
jgi:uncharacterized Fe-S cluster-containing radical SAM superfamily protein